MQQLINMLIQFNQYFLLLHIIAECCNSISEVRHIILSGISFMSADWNLQAYS